MKFGLKNVGRHDHRDVDFLKTKKLAGTMPEFPTELNVDAKLWMPNQDEANGLFTPVVPPLPYGCTDYSQSDLLANEDGKLFNPMDIENVDHANANGGTDLRTSLSVVVKLHPGHPTYLNVKSDIPQGGALDSFDAVRVAVLVGQSQKKEVTIGTNWYPEFENPINGIVPMYSSNPSGGHNWTSPGWTTINGVLYLIAKSWQGPEYGDNGYCYFSREIFNSLMANGGQAFTLSKLGDGEQPVPVSSTIAQYLTSLFWQLMNVFV